ncbi:ABC transporter permease [Isoptericola variabilis]|uniref:ABC-type transporter, integral membrane subunit n=1 Tax=Isoptericola variabilis (strain 225) TaxID=743718 RepID=F6FR38_ISOV2|nr:ABC transporter permease [Isoptericola variabilis]AEG44988.1 ABC-type transporter, integral membrane subunit [Isoptericola variabilis 225]TWH26000.1 peptide/nickel transport system permease protein [Isoptericola variabilis J7]
MRSDTIEAAVLGAAVRRQPRRALALAGLLLLLGYALLVPQLVPVDLDHVDYATGATAPSWRHPFGTDLAGRDLFVRSAHGLRISLIAALAGALGAVVVGTLAGSTCALLGGRVDRWGMRVVDGVNAVPHLLLGIVVASALRGSFATIVLVVAVTHWTQTARLVRAELLALGTQDFYRAAVSLGLTRGQLLRHHAGPRLATQLAVAFGLLVPHAVWHESTLTFLGLGLPPHEPSLGVLLDLGQQALLSGDWWTLAAPAGLLVAVTVCLAACLAGPDADRKESHHV